MKCFQGGRRSEDIKAQIILNRQVEKEIRESKKEASNDIRVLLLGTGESGKSTVAKQMKIIHTGFSKHDLLSYKTAVLSNTITCIRVLINEASNRKFELEPSNKKPAEMLLKRAPINVEEITPDVAEAIIALWEDPSIQKAFNRRSEYHLLDSAQYCLQNVYRFVGPEYVPTEADMLQVRVATSGIVETIFTVKQARFCMIDVGGQRSERRKWIHCFENVTAMIYCVALNEYDMNLYEDMRVNRMRESMELFDAVANSRWFTRTATIIFFNKHDLFDKKIKDVDLSVLFKAYTGGSDSAIALKYIQDQFFSLLKPSSKQLYGHVTCAISTENIRIVFDTCRQTIMTQNLQRLGAL